MNPPLVSPLPHPSPHSPPTSQLHLLLPILLLPCLVFRSSSLTTVQSIFSFIISTDQFNGTIGVRQAFTHSLVKIKKRETWPRSWGQKRRPKGNQNTRKGPLGDWGPLKGNPDWHNAILVSCRGGYWFLVLVAMLGLRACLLAQSRYCWWSRLILKSNISLRITSSCPWRCPPCWPRSASTFFTYWVLLVSLQWTCSSTCTNSDCMKETHLDIWEPKSKKRSPKRSRSSKGEL